MGLYKILFLDDMPERFAALADVTSHRDDLQITWAISAAEAIECLSCIEYDQVFLDHDLSLDDIMCAPGDPNAKVPTGMAVVDHILTMERPPPHVIVHTHNTPASMEMARRLDDHPINAHLSAHPTMLGPWMQVTRLPFAELIRQLRDAQRRTLASRAI